ncbi:MAG: ATP-binding cassette domain-containing protein, partial [Chryseobacterium sp.]|nr:ATP-binding cassette domain-containing protein [Chryseobacterium sp.]
NSNEIPLDVKDVVMMGRYPYFDSQPRKEDFEAMNTMMNETEVEHLKDREYNSLSGGEKQRVHLSRVMAQLENKIAHKLVFLDEPLNNLDVKHQYKALEIIKNFTRKGNSAIVVLHDLNLAAQFADKILLMKSGKVSAYGTPQEVFTAETISEAYNFPCTICGHPITNNPMIIFG